MLLPSCAGADCFITMRRAGGKENSSGLPWRGCISFFWDGLFRFLNLNPSKKQMVEVAVRESIQNPNWSRFS
jgi:hypothetical protein